MLMNRLGKIILLLAAVLFAAACGGSATAPEATAVPVDTSVPAATAAPTEVPVAASDDDAHDPENWALIGNTGKPQLINVYANW